MDINLDMILKIALPILTIIFGALSAYFAENEKLQNDAIKYIAEAEEIYKDATKPLQPCASAPKNYNY